MIRWLLSLLPPSGYTLMAKDGAVVTRIPIDGVHVNWTAITANGRHYVRTPLHDDHGFRIYREGHETYEYRSHND